MLLTTSVVTSRLYDVCVPPTASGYGCESWGLLSLAGADARCMDDFAAAHIKVLKEICGVSTSVHHAILFRELETTLA